MDYERLAEELFQQLKTNCYISLPEVLNDFSKGEIGVLSYLSFNKNDVSAGELSDELKVSTARIASILNSLENKKYIKRRSDKKDKRKILVSITNKGKNLAIDTKRDIICKIMKIIEEVGYEEILVYTKIALKIRNILNEI